MGFEFHPVILLFVVLGAFGLFVALNREKVHELNKRWDEQSKMPRFFHRTYKDPKGRRNQFGAAGVAVMSVLLILGIGFGVIEM